MNEIIQNIFSQGGLLVIILKYLNIKINIFNTLYELNYSIILLYGLWYATMHHIMFNIKRSKEHEYHHYNKKTNFNGEQVFDILFNTHADCDNENINHLSVNLIIIAFIISYLKNKFLIKNDIRGVALPLNP